VASADTMIGSVVMRPRRVGRVGQQEAHVVGPLRSIRPSRASAALLAELRDQVGRVIRLHLVEHVGGVVVNRAG